MSFSLFLKVGHKTSTATDNLMPNKLGILGLRGIKDLQVKTEKECGFQFKKTLFQYVSEVTDLPTVKRIQLLGVH